LAGGADGGRGCGFKPARRARGGRGCGFKAPVAPGPGPKPCVQHHRKPLGYTAHDLPGPAGSTYP